jgi:hypothetical protein
MGIKKALYIIIDDWTSKLALKLSLNISLNIAIKLTAYL